VPRILPLVLLALLTACAPVARDAVMHRVDGLESADLDVYDEVRSAAEAAAVALCAHKPGNFEQDAARVLPLLTRERAEVFRRTRDSRFSTSRLMRSTVALTVDGGGIVDDDRGRISVLVTGNIQVQGPTRADDWTTRTYAVLEMERVAGRWLVDGIQAPPADYAAASDPVRYSRDARAAAQSVAEALLAFDYRNPAVTRRAVAPLVRGDELDTTITTFARLHTAWSADVVLTAVESFGIDDFGDEKVTVLVLMRPSLAGRRGRPSLPYPAPWRVEVLKHDGVWKAETLTRATWQPHEPGQISLNS
jgi:hypothetical protein